MKSKKSLFLALFFIIITIFLTPFFNIVQANELDDYFQNNNIKTNGTETQTTEVGDKYLDSSATSTVQLMKSQIDRDSGSVSYGIRNKEAVNNSLNNLYGVIKDVITWLMAFGMLSAILIMIFNFVKLATIPSHPIKRRECIEKIIISIITVILTGGLSVVLSIIYGTFQESLNNGLIFSKDWRYPAVVFLNEYRSIITGFFGVATLTMLLALGYSFLKLVLSGENPQKKQQAISSILITSCATAGVGGVLLITSLFTGLIAL